MVDPFDNFTVGLEYNFGRRENKYYNIEYAIKQPLDSDESHTQSRLATRISFGVFYNF